MEYIHKPVLLHECIDALRIRPDGIYVDGTLGRAGHSREIAKRLTTGRLICIDRDQAAIDAAKAQYTGAYDQVYATYDVTSGAWTVSFSKSAAGAKTDRLVVDAAGKVMAAGK